VNGASPVTVRMIAFLDTYRKDRGLPATVYYELDADACTAEEIARALDLPVERIEGVFHNYRGEGLDALIRPGDRVAFVPFGTPASHPAFFGSFKTRDTEPAATDSEHSYTKEH
jgi:hypothetical protein